MAKTITNILWTKVLESDILYPTLAKEERKIPQQESLNKIFTGDHIKTLHTTEKTGVVFQVTCVIRALARQVSWFAIGIISTTAAVPYHAYQGYRYRRGEEQAWALLKDLRIGGLTTLTLYAIPYIKKNWRMPRDEFKKLPFKERFLTYYPIFGIAHSCGVSWNPLLYVENIKDENELNAFWVSLVLKRYFGIMSKENTFLNTDPTTDQFESFQQSSIDDSLLSTSLLKIYGSTEIDIFQHIDALCEKYPQHWVPYPPTPANYQHTLKNLLDRESDPEKKQFIQNWGETLEKYHRTLNIIATKIFCPIETIMKKQLIVFPDFSTQESQMRQFLASYKQARINEGKVPNITVEKATKELYSSLSTLPAYPDDKEKSGIAYEFAQRLSKVNIPICFENMLIQMSPKICPFELLGVEQNASSSTVSKAYKKLAIKIHPDKHQAENGVETYEEKLFKSLCVVKALADAILEERKPDDTDDTPDVKDPPTTTPLFESGDPSGGSNIHDLD